MPGKEELPFSVQKKTEIKQKILAKKLSDALKSGGEFSSLRQSFDRYKQLKHDVRDRDYHLLDDNVCNEFLELLNTIYLSSRKEEEFFENSVKNKDKEMEKVAEENNQPLTGVMKAFSGLYSMADSLKNATFGERYRTGVYNPIKEFLGKIKAEYNKIFIYRTQSVKNAKEAKEKNIKIKKDIEGLQTFLFTSCKALQGKVSAYINYRMKKIDDLNNKYKLGSDFLVDEELVFFRVLYSIAGVKCPKETSYFSYNDGITSSDSGLLYRLVENTSDYVEKVLTPEEDKDDFDE